MAYDPEEDCFTCAEGRSLFLRRETSELLNGHFVTTAHYRCEDCKGCPRRSACCQAKDPEQPKEITLKKTFWEKRAVSQANIMTERGIYLRMCRSIQVEGAFGVLKSDYDFQRFLLRGKTKVKLEILLLCFGYNINKLHTKIQNDRLASYLFPLKTA